jgi:uncharacterized protein (TIGR02611 family)
LGFLHDEVWGDEPSEVDATAVVAEMEALEPAFARRWQDHPVWMPIRAVGKFVRRSGKRMAVAVVGFVVLVVGLVLIPLPGPGWLVVFAGLAILATEFAWAERLLRYAKDKAVQAKDAVLRQDRADEAAPESPVLGEEERERGRDGDR